VTRNVADILQVRELDWTCVTWDGDLRFSGADWTCHDFRGKRWQDIKFRKQKRPSQRLPRPANQGPFVRAIFWTKLSRLTKTPTERQRRSML